MEFTAENLEKAVCLFYRTEAAQQAEAHQWLTEAQNSSQAWSFVWELLHPQRASEVQFFAATTLHNKILKAWDEVPQEHYENLKKRILDAIVNFAMGPKIVLNRLCITLSAYIIHTVPHHWPKAFEELVSSFQPQYLPNVEPERVIWILLEILTVIPEEFESTTLATSQRHRVKAVLQEVSKDILKVVEMCLVPIPNANFDMSNITTYLHSSRCAAAWIQLGGVTIDDCSRVMNLLVDLTCFVYWHRSDTECVGAEEMELIEVTLEALTAVVQHPHTTKYPGYVMKHTTNMLDKFNKILANEKASAELNKDIVTSIYLLIETIGDTHCKLFVAGLRSNEETDRKIANDLFACILGCTDLPGTYPVDETSSTVTFGFWYTLQDDILSLDTAQCAELLLIIKPYYRQLTCVMLRKSMFPSNDEASGWTLDDKEMFRCYRQDISDTFMYCYSVLNIEMLDILILQLQDALAKCVVNAANWNLVESVLHAFSSVAECIELENLFLPKLMHMLKTIPYDDLHVKVLSSCLECVGAYSEWLADHPNMLCKVVPLVITGLSNPDVSPAATMALKDLTHNCQKFLLPYAEQILIACQHGLQSGNLKLSEMVRIMYSVGKVLSIVPVANTMQYLNVILAPSFEEIQTLLAQPASEPIAVRLATKLKILSALFGSLHVQAPDAEDIHCIQQQQQQQQRHIEQPLLLVVQNTMSLYTLIGSKYHTNTEVIEVLSLLLKQTLTTLMDDSKPLVNDILTLVVRIYRETPQPSILVVAKTAMLLFGKDPEYVATMQHLLAEIIATSLTLIAQLNGTNTLGDKTDLIEGFFSLLAQIFKKVAILIANGNVDCAALFQCATVCLGMNELAAIKACTAFLVNFVTHSRETGQAAVVQNYGEALVMRVLLSLGSAPRASADVLADILLALNKKYCDNLARWLQGLLQQEGFPSPRVNAQQKEHFVKAVLREKANKRKLSETVTEFTLLCRGILTSA